MEVKITSRVAPGIIVMLFGFAGVIFAFIEKTLYDQGVMVTALANMGLTLTELMTITIVLWLLVGCIVGLFRG